MVTTLYTFTVPFYSLTRGSLEPILLKTTWPLQVKFHQVHVDHLPFLLLLNTIIVLEKKKLYIYTPSYWNFHSLLLIGYLQSSAIMAIGRQHTNSRTKKRRNIHL